LYGTFSVTSVLVLEVKTSGDVIWVRVDNLGESDPTLRFEKTIEGLRYRYRERDEDDAEDRARNKIRFEHEKLDLRITGQIRHAERWMAIGTTSNAKIESVGRDRFKFGINRRGESSPSHRDCTGKL
jgi:hypothetical protein